MISTPLKVLLTISAALALTACGGTDDKTSDPEYGQEISDSWSINDVRLRCENDSICPDNSGVLMVVSYTTEYNYYYTTRSRRVYRCTGTIYDTHKVITAGHCVDRFSSASQIWFKTAEKPGRASRTFKVNSNVLRSDWSSDDLWKADYAAIELQEPATGITFARPPLQLPANTQHMIALVVNEQYSTYDLKLSALKCTNQHDEGFPLTYDMHPDKYLVTGCKAVGGNSGGAVVAANDYNSVLGIVSAGPKDPEKSSFGDIFSKFLTPQKPMFADMNFGIITNARCISLPGWPSAQAGCLVMNKDVVVKYVVEGASKAALTKVREQVGTWMDSENSKVRGNGVEIRFAPEPAPYKYSNRYSSSHMGFAFMPIPLCFEANPKFANDKATDFRLRLTLHGTSGTTPTDYIPVSGTYKRLANGNYNVTYQYFGAFDHTYYEFTYSEKSLFKKLAKMGIAYEVQPCKGDEREQIVSIFRDRPPAL